MYASEAKSFQKNTPLHFGPRVASRHAGLGMAIKTAPHPRLARSFFAVDGLGRSEFRRDWANIATETRKRINLTKPFESALIGLKWFLWLSVSDSGWCMCHQLPKDDGNRGGKHPRTVDQPFGKHDGQCPNEKLAGNLRPGKPGNHIQRRMVAFICSSEGLS